MVTYSPEQLAEMLSRPCPNRDQQAVIQADLKGPRLVIAGAGAGKTETMALRVVYLVANQLCRPDQILGLTFTTKAAGELDERISTYLRRIANRIPQLSNLINDSDLGAGHEVSTYNAFANQIVNQFGIYLGVSPDSRMLSEASAYQIMEQLIRERKTEVGVEESLHTLIKLALQLSNTLSDHLLSPERIKTDLEMMAASLLSGQGSARSKGPNLKVRGYAYKMKLRADLLDVVRAFADYKRQHHYLDYGDQIALAARLVCRRKTASLVAANYRHRYQVILLDEFQDTSVAQLILFSKLFHRKAVLGVGDPNQSIYAWRGASELSIQNFLREFGAPASQDYFFDPACPQNGGRKYSMPITYRNYPQVLLAANRIIGAGPAAKTAFSPETSPSPSDLKTPEDEAEQSLHVTFELVGKYADQVEEDYRDFKVETTPSRYNLGAANAQLPADLAVYFPDTPAVSPAPLRSVKSQGGKVKTYFAYDRQDEAEYIAQYFAQKWQQRDLLKAQGTPEEKLPTGAILVRSHAQTDILRQALEAAQVPVQVASLPGLLTDPAVADVYAALEVTADAGAGPALMRLIVGCGIGPGDLEVLWQWARHLAKEASPEGQHPPAFLFDALNQLPPPDWTPASGGGPLSPAAAGRLKVLSKQLAALRTYAHSPLPELIQRCVYLLNLDLDAYTANAGGFSINNLDRFIQTAKEYQEETLEPTLGSFITWLKISESESNSLNMVIDEPSRDAVQILTIHAAKGLEWTWVAIPGLDESPRGGNLPKAVGKTPSDYRDSGWLTSSGELPYDLRADAEILPQYTRAQHQGLIPYFSQQSFSKNAKVLEEYQRALGWHSLANDRKLAYVAITRAEKEVLLGGAKWKPETLTARYPSLFLAQISPQAAKLREYQLMMEKRSKTETDYLPPPQDFPPVWNSQAVWPPDPTEKQLGIQRLAQDFNHTSLGKAWDFPTLADQSVKLNEPAVQNWLKMAKEHSPYMFEAASLLWEMKTNQHHENVYLPTTMAVTRMEKLASNPQDFALELRRPLPSIPTRGAQIGTLFHAWVDAQLKQQSFTLPPGLDNATLKSLRFLQRQFQNLDLLATWEPVASEADIVVEAAVKLNARIDAIFRHRSSGQFAIFDWKTDRVELEESGQIIAPDPVRLGEYLRQIQQYRLIYARHLGVQLEQVEGVLVFLRRQHLVYASQQEAAFKLPGRLEDFFRGFNLDLDPGEPGVR